MRNSQIKNLQEQIFQLREKITRLTKYILEADGEQSGGPQQGGSSTPAQKPLPTPKIVPVSGSNTQGSGTSTTTTSRGPRGNRKPPIVPRPDSAPTGSSSTPPAGSGTSTTTTSRGPRGNRKPPIVPRPDYAPGWELVRDTMVND
jgi:hypothetical protein